MRRILPLLLLPVCAWAQGVYVERIAESGGRISILRSTGEVAFDRLGRDLQYDVYVNLRQPRALTDGHAQVPQLSNGQPCWHPGGEWIAFQARNPALTGLRSLGRLAEGVMTSPGAGIQNNVWMVRRDASSAVQLTNVPDRGGVLHPHFSPDGNRLVWAEHLPRASGRPTNHWAIRIADVVFEDGAPSLRNTRTLRPRNHLFYETHGFTPDGRRLIFTACPTENYWGLDVYLMEPGNEASLQRLTDDDEWDEHAHVSPDGRFLVWGSSRGIAQRKQGNSGRMDYWIMRIDGTGATRLTFFNEPGHPHEIAGGAITSDFDWQADGLGIVAFVQVMRRRAASPIYRITFDPAAVLTGVSPASTSGASFP